MAFNVGSITAQVKADISGYTKGIADVKSQTKGLQGVATSLGGFVGGIESTVMKVAKTAVKGVSILGGALSVAGGFALKSASDFEQTKIGLTNMLGSASKAGEVLAQVNKFAAETPFEFPELAASVKQLVAFGFTGDDAVKTMEQLGDVSAAIGAPIGDLSYLLGTIKTQGKAMTIDIRQFAQRGIPIYEYLAKVLNTDTEKLDDLITSGKVGFPEVQKAFEMMTAEGGKFHGTMAAQSKSLAGLMSTLSDSIGMAAKKIVGIDELGNVREGSIFDITRNAAGRLIDYLNAHSEEITAWATKLVNEGVAWTRDVAVPWVKEHWPAIQLAIKNAAGAVVDIVKWIGEHKAIVELLLGAYVGLKLFLIGFEIWQKGTLLWSGMSGAIQGVTTAIAAKGGLIAMLGTAGSSLAGLAANPWTITIVASLIAFAAIYDAGKKLKDDLNTLSAEAKVQWWDSLTPLEKFGAWITGNKPNIRSAPTSGSGGGGWGNVDTSKDVFNLIPKFASGISGFGGGLAYVHKGEVLANLPAGTDVIPAKAAKQMLGGSKNYNITIEAGNLIASDTEVRQFARKLQTAFSEIAEMKGV